jgi:hypothetical protein
MQLKITKNSGKPHLVLYKRDNGTETWMTTDAFFVRHDLSHYAVEKTLGYTTAFMGMLNSGIEINDFEDRNKRKAMKLTAEAVYAENIANLFLMEMAQGETEDMNQVIAESFNTMGQQLAPVRLSDHELQTVRLTLRQLLNDWNALPVGRTMTLDF